MAYTDHYPTLDDTHVKDNNHTVGFDAYLTFDTSLANTGVWDLPPKCWLVQAIADNERFNIDLGAAFIIRNIKYINGHYSGDGQYGMKNFTFWGSNNAAAFADTDYTHDTNWTQITTSASVFTQTPDDTGTFNNITADNSTAYQYYSIKMADTYDGAWSSFRRIILQTEDGYNPPGGSTETIIRRRPVTM